MHRLIIQGLVWCYIHHHELLTEWIPEIAEAGPRFHQRPSSSPVSRSRGRRGRAGSLRRCSLRFPERGWGAFRWEIGGDGGKRLQNCAAIASFLCNSSIRKNDRHYKSVS